MTELSGGGGGGGFQPKAQSFNSAMRWRRESATHWGWMGLGTGMLSLAFVVACALLPWFDVFFSFGLGAVVMGAMTPSAFRQRAKLLREAAEIEAGAASRSRGMTR